MANVSIFKVVAHEDGTFTLNQEANGYWWYHETRYGTEEEAREAVNRWASDKFPARIDQTFVPLYMRPTRQNPGYVLDEWTDLFLSKRWPPPFVRYALGQTWTTQAGTGFRLQATISYGSSGED